MSNEVKTVDSTDIVVMGSIAPQAVDMGSPGAVEYRLRCIEAMMDLKDKVLDLCIRKAKPADITDLGGKPYFTESFCEQILSRLGNGSVQILSKEFDQQEDGHYGYTVQVRVEVSGLGTADGIGMATSNDSFLGVNNSRALDKVSRHNLLQHARTRAVGKALRGLFGLEKFTWNELSEMGFVRNDSAKVDYKKKAPAKDGGATAATKKILYSFINDGDWSDINKAQQDLGIKGKSVELSEDDMKRLIAELESRKA
jgi:hypothetical protein